MRCGWRLLGAAFLLGWIILPNGHAAVFSENCDTEVSGAELLITTPDVGTSWTRVIQNSGATIQCSGIGDLDLVSSGTSRGVLYTANATYPSANYTLAVTMVGSPSSDDYQWLVARYQDTSNYYACRFTVGATAIHKVVAGSASSLGTGSGIADGSTVECKINGTAIDLLDDSSAAVSVTDSDISAAGKGGLGCGFLILLSTDDCANTDNDDFVITDLGGGAARRVIFAQ